VREDLQLLCCLRAEIGLCPVAPGSAVDVYAGVVKSLLV
jgi:hypothetical protein